MSSRPRALLAIVTAVLGFYAQVVYQPALGRQDAGLEEHPAPGVTVTTLASHILDEGQDGGLFFDRIPLASGDSTLDVLTPSETSSMGVPRPGPFTGGPQLFYVESGQVTVTEGGNDTSYAEGEQFVMPPGAEYDIQNNTGRCASMLRLVVEPLYGGGFGTDVRGPALAAQDCGEPRVLVSTILGGVVPPSGPSQAFIAQVEFDPSGYEPGGVEGLGTHTHPGFTAIVVETGTMVIESRSDEAFMMHIHSPGGTVLIGSDTPHAEYFPHGTGSESAVITMAGVVPLGEALIIPHDGQTASAPDSPSIPTGELTPSAPTSGGTAGNTYTSPDFGYSVTWDASVWSVPDNGTYREPGYNSLLLEAATGPLWVTGTSGYGGDVNACLEAESALQSDPADGISEWQVAVDASGNQLTGTTATSAWGVYTSVYTDPADPSAEPVPYVDYINCVSLRDGESVVVFTTFAEREDYNEHIGHVQAVVESLQPPGTGG